MPFLLVFTRRPDSTALVTSEAYNTSRAMGARATCYSRHTLSREGSAERTRQSGESVDTGSAQAHSGGRTRSLHVTSADNPFLGGTGQAQNNRLVFFIINIFFRISRFKNKYILTKACGNILFAPSPFCLKQIEHNM